MGEHQVGQPAVFLDRDGVLNRPVIRDGRPFPPGRAVDFELYDNVAESCTRLKAAGFLLVVVTNQPDVGRGTQTRAEIELMHAKLRETLPMLDAIEVCWHAGEKYGEACDCRKPRPGMVLRAATTFRVDVAKSYLIGDRWRDVDCAHAAGCRAVFIDRGYDEVLRDPPEFTASGFSEAVVIILADAVESELRLRRERDSP